MIVYRL